MTGQAPFSWRQGEGWLVLSGGAHHLSEIRAMALSRCNPGTDIACISQADDLGDAVMDDLAELGAPTGYHIDLAESDNNLLYERITSAGLIIITAGCADWLRGALRQTAVHALKEAFSSGTLLLCEGAAAELFAEHRVLENGWGRGLNFVQGAAILSSATGSIELPARLLQRALPDMAVIILARGSALALGPGGQLETWGDRDITIRIGARQR